jgi:hypothetical protein
MDGSDQSQYGQPNRRLLFLAIVVVTALCLLSGLIYVLTRGTAGSGTDKHNLKITTITSPITHNTEQLAINYGGSSDPNYEAVKQQFKIFGIDKLTLGTAVTYQLKQLLPNALMQQFTPTFPTTYVHIDPKTITCDRNGNCGMSIYIDSPELYFHLDLSQLNGVYVMRLSQVAWEGIQR